MTLSKTLTEVNHHTHHFPTLSIEEISGAKSCAAISFTVISAQANPCDLKIAGTPLIKSAGVGRSMG